MGRFAIIPALALLLACCGGREPVRPQTLKAEAGFTGPDAAVIEVRITEIPPGVQIERVVVLDPAGRELAASELLRSESEAGPGLVSRPSLGVAVTGGSSSGVKPAISLGMSVSGGGPSRRSRKMTARIPLPDPAVYRATAARWRIEVRYLDVAETPRVLTVRAPRFE